MNIPPGARRSSSDEALMAPRNRKSSRRESPPPLFWNRRFLILLTRSYGYRFFCGRRLFIAARTDSSVSALFNRHPRYNADGNKQQDEPDQNHSRRIG